MNSHTQEGRYLNPLTDYGFKKVFGEKDILIAFHLHPVYGVFFMNFHMKGLKPQAIRTIQLKVDETGEIFSKKLKAFTLELIDFKDKPEEYPTSQIEYWLYILANMETMTTALPFQAQQPIFSKVGGISELSHMDSEERRKYFTSLNKYRTNLSVMQNERAEGFADGEAKGRVEEKLAIARTMKNMGLDVSVIMQATDLPTEEIAAL